MGAAEVCFSRCELAEICRSPRKATQIEFLRKNGIRHYIDSHGWPVVLRSALEGSGPSRAPTAEWKPNKAA